MTHHMQPGYSIVIPVYNSETTLPLLIERLTTVMKSLKMPYEIIMVVDGSPDNSWNTLLELQKRYPNIHGIHLMRNYGQPNALLRGIRFAHYDTIVTMDDDLQNPPEEIPILLNELDQGYDVVYGFPEKSQHNLFRNLSSQITKRILRLGLGIEGIERSGAFRAFRTTLRDSFENYRSSYVSIDVLLSWGTTRFGYIPVRHSIRMDGNSNYNFRNLIGHALNLITGFSTLPLQIASWLGFALTLFGFGILIYVLGRYLLQGSPVQGFPFLASIIAIFSGAQLFSLGIFGEYLARMYFRMIGKPQSTVREKSLAGKTDHKEK